MVEAVTIVLAVVLPIVCLGFLFAIFPLLIAMILLWFSLYLFIYLKCNRSRYMDRREFWAKPTLNISKFINFFSWLFHGHEIHGLENIPLEGPALIIFYHAASPFDYGYAAARIYSKTSRKIIPIVEKKTFGTPGIQTYFEAFEATPGTVETCIEILNNGDLLAISPGGVREMLFSDENYDLLWNNRKGFAKVACEAKVPIIPLFTQNSREMYLAPKIGIGFFRRMYETRRYLYVPSCGWFPVKLKTFIGKPIEFDPNRSVDETAEISKKALEDLIEEHQETPGSIFRALKERIV